MGRLCLKYITATALLFIFVAVCPQRVKCNGALFELILESLENSDGREITGVGCCSGLPPRADASCPGDCSVYLHFCIQNYQEQPSNHCPYFELQTVLLSQNGTTSYDISRQEKMVFDLPFKWPGNFNFLIEAWHPPDSKNKSRNLVERFSAKRNLTINTEWTADFLFTNRTTLRIKYRVFCKPHYYGEACETLCRDRDDRFGHFYCSENGTKICLPGWGDDNDYCNKALCEPECLHGICDGQTPNKCRCQVGWTGPVCETCMTHPGCVHGRCLVPNQCLCDEGWGGLLCNQDLNYCTNHKPCQHGGTCTNTGQGNYTCSCSEYFMGRNCEIHKNPCVQNPCENGGSCENPIDGQYTCSCALGYFGPRCETWANICSDDICVNGGSCIQDPNGFICSCPVGYTGLLCEEIDETNCQVYPCLNGGTCVNSSDGFQCVCRQGTSGSRCENANHCSSNSCEHGGTCVELHDNITCLCPSGFSGTYCQYNHNKCSLNPCANGATCYNLIDGYQCDCAAGFFGQNCNFVDPCISSPCLNGASCQPTERDFICHCLNGYRGDRCHLTEIDWKEYPSVASNVSHRISQEEEDGSKVDIVLISTLSSILVILIILILCVLRCLLIRRRRHRQHMDKPQQKAKDCDFDLEEERLQNERNAMHMNYKQCDMPQKIVNELDRVPAKLVNEAKPKVLNNEVNNKKIPDKSLVCPPRTFQKIDNTSGSSLSCHSSQDYPPCHSGGIYVIEDHLKSHPGLGKEDILATEV
ncbi:Neurogenic locus protein delta [Araneus ventricosus]|uniref:Delta-like protein n=1 Tax=Araneus ventricosus TaxID=182803 RepID=A0A4Y2EWF7_ARAVE|nr:Neurogenic locus protein delta [Araneus ventricosus]